MLVCSIVCGKDTGQNHFKLKNRPGSTVRAIEQGLKGCQESILNIVNNYTTIDCVWHIYNVHIVVSYLLMYDNI